MSCCESQTSVYPLSWKQFLEFFKTSQCSACEFPVGLLAGGGRSLHSNSEVVLWETSNFSNVLEQEHCLGCKAACHWGFLGWGFFCLVFFFSCLCFSGGLVVFFFNCLDKLRLSGVKVDGQQERRIRSHGLAWPSLNQQWPETSSFGGSGHWGIYMNCLADLCAL